MSRVLPSTILAQQSFNPDWVISPIHIPTGIILSCQFTTTVYANIYLSSISVRYGVLNVAFTQNGVVCAYITTEREGCILPLHVNGSIISATLEIGVIPKTDVLINVEKAMVSSKYINVVNNDEGKPRFVTIYQNNVPIRREIDNALEITLGDALDATYSKETGNLLVGVNDDSHKELFTNFGGAIIRQETDINMINGIRANNGSISVNIYNAGALIPVTKMSDNWVVLENRAGLSFCPSFVDPIDNYIAPYTHIGYYPLDDAYIDNVRDTNKLEGKHYGGFYNTTKIDLHDIDASIDTIEATDENSSSSSTAEYTGDAE